MPGRPSLIIHVGTHKTEQALRVAVLVAGCGISGYASDIMLEPAFVEAIPQSEEDIEFVIVSNRELGFPSGTFLGETFGAGRMVGFKPCLPSDGAEICCRPWLDQDIQERIIIASEPILHPKYYHGLTGGVFCLSNSDSRLYLGACNGDPSCHYVGDRQFIFRV